MNLRSAATFPCNLDKSPIPRRGFKDAIRGVDWRRAPLVGFPTGAVNGIDALDVDGDAGREWYDTNFDAIPVTRAHSTRRGMHLLFRAAPGLRCTESKLAKGVDVRAEGGYVIWWPREGFPVEDAPISEWPDWLLKEAMLAMRKGKAARRSEVYPTTTISPHAPQEVSSLTKALFALDPREWSGGSEEGYGAWLRLMIACKSVGIAEQDFVEWSVSDPDYAGHESVIRSKWHSITPGHGGALYAALAGHGITIQRRARGKDRSGGVHISAVGVGNLQSRSRGLIDWLSRNATGDGLFSATCLLAELGLTQDAATKLVDGNLPRLRRALGEAEFNRQIDNAFAHVANKLEPQS
jgi:Bifunctional DNA primase/polymerase, N-terminal/Primase C terminal 2 (PriCT-2)